MPQIVLCLITYTGIVIIVVSLSTYNGERRHRLLSSSGCKPLSGKLESCLYRYIVSSSKVVIQHRYLVTAHSESLQHLLIWLLAEVRNLRAPTILSQPSRHIGAVPLQPLDLGSYTIQTLG